MATISTAQELRAAIVQLELLAAEQKQALKADLNLTYSALTPGNILRAAIKDVTEVENFKENLAKTGIALLSGYLSEIAILKVSHGPLQKIIGSILSFGVTNVIAKNPGILDSIGRGIKNFAGKYSRNPAEPQPNVD